MLSGELRWFQIVTRDVGDIIIVNRLEHCFRIEWCYINAIHYSLLPLLNEAGERGGGIEKASQSQSSDPNLMQIFNITYRNILYTISYFQVNYITGIIYFIYRIY